MANNTQVKTFRILGTTDDITACDQCGRDDLKSTVVLAYLDADGNEVGLAYMGSDCGAKAAGWTQTRVRAEARAADKARRDAEEAARLAAWDAEIERETAEMMIWAAEVYGIHAETREELFEAVRVASGRRGPASAAILFDEYKKQQAEKTEETVKNWTTMTPAEFGATTGTQLDMFAGLEGDGCGTLDLLDAAAEAETAPAVETPERTDGALFGLTDGPATGDGELFGLVAA